MLRDALDRTLLLMRTRLAPSVSDEALLAALTGTEVALVADAHNLGSHAAQCAYVAAALAMARSGHTVYLAAPDLPLAGPQPPLAAGRLIAGLVTVGADLLPGIAFRVGAPRHRVDLAVALGDSASGVETALVLHLNASRWAGRLSATRADRWQEQTWPVGALAAAGLAATEAYKIAMRKLAAFAASPVFDQMFAPTLDATTILGPEDAPLAQDLGRFDLISGGAITNALLFALARIPDVRGRARVIEPQHGDISNLNRYMLMLCSHRHFPKADDLANTVGGGLSIEPVTRRYDADAHAQIAPLAPAVVVGADDIPTRWVVQRAAPGWLGVGATELYQSVASFHRPGLACAGCAHPYDAPASGNIPTAAFVSFFGGLFVAALFARHAAGEDIGIEWQQTTFFPMRPDGGWRGPVIEHTACPVGHSKAAA